MQTRRRVKTRHHARRLYSVKAAVADQTAHHRAVLLFHERLVVLLVGPRARHLDLLFSTPRHDHVVHECAVVIEVGTTDQPWEQALRSRHRLDDQAAIPCHQRQALRPARCDIYHRERLDERTRHARAAVRNHVNLTEVRRRVSPVVERADRHLPPDGRVEAAAPTATARRRDLHVDQHSIYCRCAHRQEQPALFARRLQPAMPLECRQQCRDHRHEALAAYTIGGFPQRN